MKTRIVSFILVPLLSIIIAASASACPCSPCTCSPCTCGGHPGGGGKSSKSSKSGAGESRHGGKHRDRHEAQSSVGVGVNVDLGGVGQRKREADPFAVGNDQPVARTQEKRTQERKSTAKEEEGTTSNPFTEIKLTGKDAKAAENEPPSTVNVSNDDETPPSLPPSGNLPKTNAEPSQAVTIDDVKKKHDAYDQAQKKFFEKQPTYNQLLRDFANDSMTPEGKKKAAKAKKKLDKLGEQFDQSDEGKKLIADWKADYDNAVKSGQSIKNELIPPPQNDMEKKKYAVAKAENDLKAAQTNYQDAKNSAAGSGDNVKSIEKQMENLDLKDKPNKASQVAAQDKMNQLKDDLEKAKTKAANEWASSEKAKDMMKQVHQAEQALDKAKQDYKPFEQLEEKPTKAASNP